MLNRFFTYLFFFLSLWLIINHFNAPQEDEQQASGANLEIKINDSEILGNLVKFDLINNSNHEVVIAENQNPPESISFQKEDEQSKDFVNVQLQQEASEKIVLAPGERRNFSFSKWNNEIFGKAGDYKVCVQVENEKFCEKITLEEAGIFRSMWRALFFKPIFNALVFFMQVLPGHSLAWSILVLTIVIKSLLIIPSKNAIVQQQKMQKVQAEIEVMRQKYKGDQQKIAEETMALWKKHQVNPFSSFGPMFIQFPVMIALFYVVKEGLMPHTAFFLWPPLQDFDFEMVSQNLFGLDLASANVVWLALAVGLLQFASIKISLSLKKGKAKKGKNKKKEVQAPEPSQTKMINQMMTYGMPLMIAFFTYSMPAAVGFYWGISTAFSLVQQLLLRKK